MRIKVFRWKCTLGHMALIYYSETNIWKFDIHFSRDKYWREALKNWNSKNYLYF